MSEDSELVEKGLPCDECGSSDGVALYSDGHSFCFAHGGIVQRSTGDGTPTRKAPRMAEDLQHALDTSTIEALPSRKITQATADHYGYRVRINSRGEPEHVAVYKDEHGQPVAAKLRTKDKLFPWVGEPKEASLFGVQFLGNGGKKVILTEGEIDCLTVSQLWANKFPVVSVPNGAQAAKKDVAKVLDKLSRFEQVVICFDQDEPGRKAALEVAMMLPPGKAFIVTLPRKDANEMAVAGELSELTHAIHRATPYRPDGIVSADELDASILDPVEWGLSTPYEFLTNWTYGLRPGDLWIIGAGTGIGKSDVTAEIIAHLIKPKEDGGEFVPVAVFNYEAGAKQTYRSILGKQASKRFQIPDPKDGTPNIYWSHEELRQASAYRREKCAQLFINDHKGAISWESVKERLRYLVHAEGIVLGVVDPMAAMAAQLEDERKGLDQLLSDAKSLAEELGITLIFVSHLARPSEGKSHEEGGRVTLRNFRGSGAIVMWASYTFGMERDQQAEDPEKRGLTTFRCLKDRLTGDATGATQALGYDVITGRLYPVESKMPPPVDQTTANPEDF